MSQIAQITQKIKRFRDARDWKQFHNHKDLSLVLEATEVLEHFQWKSPQEVNQHAKDNKEDLADELADNLKIDLGKAMANKMKKNAIKYPVHKAKGKHTKYNKL